MSGADLVLSAIGVMITLPMKYWSWYIGWGLFMDQGTKQAFLALGALRMIGSCKESIHPHFQSILAE
jgi:hypothetical protein